MQDEKTARQRHLQYTRRIDFEAHGKEQINRCHHLQFKIGNLRFYFNPVTSIASAIILWAFVGYCIQKPKSALSNLKLVKDWVTEKWTWLYVGTQNVWAVFIIVLYFSKYSDMKLGKDDDEPEFNGISYFMMLYSCGISIGLFFYGVAEPIFHYVPKTPNRYTGRHSYNQQAQDAINLTFFHWGIHGWVVYTVIGLLLSFLCYRKGLPMTMRACFYPILGDLIFGIYGDLIDILCIICTIFGVSTSLGLGVIQLNHGINRINPIIEENTNNQIVIIWCITGLATISVITGLKIGIRRLSEICFGIGCFIMFFILYASNTWHLLNLFVQSVGYYFQNIIQLGFHTDAFAQLGNAPDVKENPTWIGAWTIFYWGWWISWSPFVGMFIAKISYGRTIKDFIFYTLMLPTLYSFIWMSIFGGVGIQIENNAIKLNITCDMYNEDISNPKKYFSRWEEIFAEYNSTRLSCRTSTEMWFDVINTYGDLAMFMSVLSLIAIILYFVTSSDSGSLVIDCLSANGSPDPPVFQRIFWALTEGATATALIHSGGKDSLEALQTVSIACGLPFTFCLNWTCVSMWRAIREEAGEIDPNNGRWSRSIWSLNKQKVVTVLISTLCPWYYLAKIRMKLNNQEGKLHQLLHSFIFALPFYLWFLLMIVEVEVDKISYVGWSILMAFFALAAQLRGKIRTIYDIEGNMVEDIFAFALVYPLAIAQANDQIDSTRNNNLDQQIELGVYNPRYTSETPRTINPEESEFVLRM